MKKLISVLCGASALLVAAPAAATVDVVEAPTGYFVPDDTQLYNSPYYRYGGSWDWTHGAIAPGFATASLYIAAFDVDDGTDGGFPPEIDNIYAMDNGAWTLLGILDQTSSDNWTYTTFDLGANFFDDIAAGLQVRVDIDVGDTGWALALSKSVLTTDGEAPPPPTPGAVPEPATWLLMMLGFGLVGGVLRSQRRQKLTVSYS